MFVIRFARWYTDHNMNGHTLNETHDMLRLDMSTQEKENFQRRMLRNLKVEVDESGEISIHIAE